MGKLFLSPYLSHARALSPSPARSLLLPSLALSLRLSRCHPSPPPTPALSLTHPLSRFLSLFLSLSLSLSLSLTLSLSLSHTLTHAHTHSLSFSHALSLFSLCTRAHACTRAGAASVRRKWAEGCSRVSSWSIIKWLPQLISHFKRCADDKSAKDLENVRLVAFSACCRVGWRDVCVCYCTHTSFFNVADASICD